MRVKPMGELISVLSEEAEKVGKLESLAEELVQDSTNLQRYRAVLEEKARVLAGLAQRARPITKKMPEEDAAPLQHMLNKFSQSAATSLRIGSPFYMSALLYPQDHQQGQPNDLEIFIEQLRQMQQ
ncbi:hypothetical protein SP90_06290 [Halodesulfovibrio spirochaetisodalis]|uniref:Uncharacterized protein n=2 Tax=Halodesulfovibrio spirochaetisodalis TaxID=1560234 RepID=A0A1B7XFL6_9BACT|nr:hypothetical protein SP90_06290 [Halodesulfovibrio spirochaetisodalis]